MCLSEPASFAAAGVLIVGGAFAIPCIMSVWSCSNDRRFMDSEGIQAARDKEKVGAGGMGG